MAEGTLHRAIVSLPGCMCPQDEPLHERVVFFETRLLTDHPVDHLQKLLALAWCQNTNGWAKRGYIYGVANADDLYDQGLSADLDARLLELGSNGGSIRYANPVRVDLFVTPLVKIRLHEVLSSIKGAQQ
ncbi:hypothetical protein D5039_22000 [Verminephrobacter aporrectodeae subsp. tuberculatae]|uniref:Uncharacterized protein n=1 Tax=Verminephrobacter aporrectodeae subsp. tuberculatae TaxID=1110392 RepID=A0ABT3KZE7_9BURK|nr:hypothetical protein [Verminephrobacter aporrectodeae]MCW5323716.1 hypothetical protein [Verminephrobacter aporrectodeae subsp. tuberculatae]